MPVNRRQIAQIRNVPAPVGGLNGRDAYAEMPARDAITLENFFPTPSYLAVRNGNAIQVSGLPGPVQTVACYSPPGATRKIFAACGASVYDVTAQGVLNAPAWTGASSAWWQHVNFGAGGGQYLVMVNGVDPMLLFNGSGWQSVGNGTGAVISSGTAAVTTCTITTATAHQLATGDTITITGATPAAYDVAAAAITVTGPKTFTYAAVTAPGGPMTVLGSYSYAPSITGVSTSLFSNVNALQGRLYFIERNSMRVWFLPALSVGGAATVLDLSSQTTLGGSLIAMATWTLETVSGIVQMACFLTSEGEVIAYQGNDPTYASSWYQVGMFRVGIPVGQRCFTKIGSDVAVITSDGLVPLSKELLTDRSQRSIALTDKIINLINDDVLAYSQYQGWQPILFPAGNKLILNVPAPTGSYQYVMNTITGMWTKFTGWNAFAWEVVGNTLFFGSNGAVYQADVGTSDSGSSINVLAIQAPNAFDSETQKQFTMARPIFRSDGPLTPAFQINPDYGLQVPVNVDNYVTSQYTPWGVPWGSPWSAVAQVYRNWLSVGSIGYVGSPAIAFASNGATVSWQSTDVAFTVGGPW